MKFICDNCKAKYQIGDDKIAGRSVRMKCRRCGHLIQLSASVTAGEAGVLAGESGAVSDASVESSVVESTSSASMSIADLLGGQPPEDPFDEGPTRAMTVEQRVAATRAATTAAATPAPAAAATPAPAPAAPGPAARPAIGNPLASGAVARPVPGAAAARPLPGAASPGAGAPRPVTGAVPAARLGALPPPAARPPAATGASPALPPVRSAAPSGVSGAFQRSMGGGPALGGGASPGSGPGKSTGGHAPHGEDWYVGVAGVPLGPVRLAVIREKALTGAVHADSLVWREGFDEWQPLKQFPELLEIVEEAQTARGASPRRPSAVPPPMRPAVLPPVRPPSVPPPAGGKLPGAPAGYQPKATAIGVGIPAVTLPARTPGAPAAAPGASPPHPVTTKSALPAPAPAPAAGAGASQTATLPSAGAMGASQAATLPSAGARIGAGPAAPRVGLGARPAATPRPEGAVPRASSPGPEPARPTPAPPLPAPAPAPPVPAPLALEPPAAPESHPLAATALSAGTRPSSEGSSPHLDATPASATDDLFGLGLGLGGDGAGAGSGPVSSSAPVVKTSPAADAAPLVVTPPPAAAPAQGTPAPAGALDVMRDPFAAPPAAPAGVSAAAAATLASAVAPGAAVAATTGRASVVPPSAPAPQAEPEDVLPRRRQGMHPLAYAFIAMAAAFGGVVAFLLFSKPAQPTIVYVPAPGASTAAPAGTGSVAVADTATSAPAGDVPTAEPSSGPKPIAGKGPGPAPTSTATSAPLDTSGFVTQVVPGPTATSTGTSGDPSLGQLSAGEIQGVVSANQARIRKRCWQPALDSAGPTASGNARVKGKIVIGPSGAVQSASASGAEKDYPGLSSCIAGQMQGWKFPPSSGTTPVDVPFVFAGQ